MRKRWRLVALVALGFAAVACIAWCLFFSLRTYYAPFREWYGLSFCKASQNVDARTTCVFGVIESELHIGGVAAAESTFKLAYDEYPDFADNGCHSLAHRIGDMTYYEIYLGTESLNSIDFPQDTTACGYGFFHGMLEHDIQDHPTTQYLTTTCDYLVNRLAGQMHDIELTCYHAGGHGLALAQTAKVPKTEWGDVAAFADVPAAQCASLPHANATDVEQCYEGIFNIIVNYMSVGNYGFTYDSKHPFATCFKQKSAIQYACIYEMAQKIDGASGDNASVMVGLVAPIPDLQQRLNAFQVGIAGIIQNTIAVDDYDAAYTQCKPLQEPYYSACVDGVAWAMFEHGDPQNEYVKALQFCADPSIAARNASETCYHRVSDEMRRFYTNDKIASICKEFPLQYQDLCEDPS